MSARSLRFSVTQGTVLAGRLGLPTQAGRLSLSGAGALDQVAQHADDVGAVGAVQLGQFVA
jgi:hypothetical protein